MGFASYFEDIRERASQADRFLKEMEALVRKAERCLQDQDNAGAKVVQQSIVCQLSLLRGEFVSIVDFITDPSNFSIVKAFDDYWGKRSAEEFVEQQQNQLAMKDKRIRELHDTILSKNRLINELESKLKDARRTIKQDKQQFDRLFHQDPGPCYDLYPPRGKK